jgi:hypothetical protein
MDTALCDKWHVTSGFGLHPCGIMMATLSDAQAASSSPKTHPSTGLYVYVSVSSSVCRAKSVRAIVGGSRMSNSL